MSDATQLVERIFQATVGMVDVATMHVGDRVGLYASLRDDGPGTARQLAERSGLDERYLREWLEQQATTGVLELDGLRRFVLPAGHAEALVDRDSPLYVAALRRQISRPTSW